MSLAKLTKKDKKQIALGMIYHSLDVGLFGDSIATNTISAKDEKEILTSLKLNKKSF